MTAVARRGQLAARVQAGEPALGRARRVGRMLRTLAATHPDAHCELDFTTPLELAVATVLSAQSTDKLVNSVTPALFARYPTALDYAKADRAELEEMIHSTGFFRNKANSLIGLGAAVVERHGGELPATLEELVKLPGIGRKTANVILGNAFDVPGITVDTHFGRLVRRWGWTAEEDPVKVEHAVGALVPQARLDDRVAPGDLPRPAGVPRPQARLRRLHPRRRLPVLRHRPDRPRRGRGAGQGPVAGAAARHGRHRRRRGPRPRGRRGPRRAVTPPAPPHPASPDVGDRREWHHRQVDGGVVCLSTRSTTAR